MNTAPLSPEQLATRKDPADPQMAPDGSRVIFVLSGVSKPDEYKRSTLWMIDPETGRVSQFTNGPRADTDPRWSPDSSQIAFVSDRKEPGKKGLYRIAATGGEAVSLVEWKAELSAPAWSRDGANLAFIAVDPETDEEAERKKQRRDQVVFEKDLKYGRLYLVPAAGGEPRLLSPQGPVHVKAFDWLPDGSGLLVATVARPLENDVGYGPTDLSIVSLDGTSRHVAGLGGIENPQVSPDSTCIAYLAKAGRVTEPGVLWVIPTAGGEPRSLTAGFPGLVEHFSWSPDGHEIYFTGIENVSGVLRAAAVDSGTTKDLLPPQTHRGSFDSAASFDRSGRTFAVVCSTPTEPPNVWISTAGRNLSRCTDLNPELTEATFSNPETISWQSSDGRTIYGLLFRPVDFHEGKHYPLVTQIHGGPAGHWSESFLCGWHDWAQPLAQRGYAVFLPNPRGSTGRGTEFMDAEANDYGGMELQDLLTGIDYVIAQGFVDPQRLGVGGWSHGGYMTAWTITQTDRFKCAVIGAGPSDLVSDQGQNDIPMFNVDYYDDNVYDNPDTFLRTSPVAHVRGTRTPALILHGEKDERVSVAQGHEMFRALRWAGVETHFVIYPREPHGIRERAHQIDLIERVLAWLDRFLQPSD